MFSNLNGINTAAIKCNIKGIYYNDKQFIVQTGLVKCQLTEDGKLRCQLSTHGRSVLEKLEEMVHILAKQEDMEHHARTLADGWLNLPLQSWTRFFDSNRAPISATDVMSEFTGIILLDLSKIIVFEGKLMQSLSVMQVMVRAFCVLPQGCVIYRNINDLREALKPKDHGLPASAVSQDFEDINELL